jgi:hypothetical protein
VEHAPNQKQSSEEYWANDLEDLLDGRCDEFSLFCRQPFSVEQLRLWGCIATPLLNSEFVYKKVQLHFTRAQKGHTPKEWILEMYAPYIGTNEP